MDASREDLIDTLAMRPALRQMLRGACLPARVPMAVPCRTLPSPRVERLADYFDSDFAAGRSNSRRNCARSIGLVR